MCYISIKQRDKIITSNKNHGRNMWITAKKPNDENGKRAGLEVKSRAFSVFKAAFPSATARRARREKSFWVKELL